jgi:hypothetical protein
MAKALKWEATSDAGLIGRMQSALNKQSGTIKERRAIVAASCVLHMLEHGNATPMTRFVKEAGDDVRQDAIVKWALKTGAFRVGKAVDADTKKSIDVFKKNEQEFDKTKATYEADKAAYAKALVDKPFYTVIKQANPFKGIKVINLIHMLVKQADDALADPTKKDHKDNNWQGLEEARAITHKYGKVAKAKASEQAPAPTAPVEPIDDADTAVNADVSARAEYVQFGEHVVAAEVTIN